jgi:hypothetical protein
MNQAANKTPVPNHVHGRVTDINDRLKLIRNQFSRVLDRLRPMHDEEAESKASVISHSVQDKLIDTSDLVHELEILANEYEQYIGTADEDVPKGGQLGRAIG